MKKKITLLSMILTLSVSYIFSQSLAYTTWKGFEKKTSITRYLRFTTDSVLQSPYNDTFITTSSYQTNGNNLAWYDVSGRPCEGIISQYTFLFHWDTLKFTHVNDKCPDRPGILTGSYWTRQFSGVQEENLAKSINMYPNPTSGSLSIPIDGNKNIIVTNLQGQILKTIETDSKTISLADLGTGNYFVSVFNKDNRRLTTKLIVCE